jgi:O-antigen/teichoic acid export membrane protein
LVAVAAALAADAYRHWLLAVDDEVGLVLVDGFWLGIQTIGTLVVLQSDDGAIEHVVLAWGLGAFSGLCVAAARLRTRKQHVPTAFRRVDTLKSRFHFAAENMVQAALAPLSLIVVATLGSSLSSAGILRLAQIGFSLATVLQAAMKSLGARESATLSTRSALAMNVGVVTTATAATAATLLLMPTQLMELVLGDGWSEAKRLVPLVAVARVGFSISAACTVSLRLAQAGQAALRLRVISVTTTLVTIALAAKSGDVLLVSSADAASQWLVAPLWLAAIRMRVGATRAEPSHS